jgi:hypothetical protein
MSGEKPDRPPVACPLVRDPSFEPCDPAELEPLLHWLESGLPATELLNFRRGTALPDGRLDLCKQAIGPGGMERVLAALHPGSGVKHLLLGADGLGDEGARSLAGHMASGGRLETAFLGCNRIGATGAAALCEALGDDTSLRGLWLKRNPLGDEGARAVAGLLRRNRTLRTLDLVNTGIGKAGLAAILDALAENPSVERLYLGGNGIEDAAPIAALLRARPTLRELYLSANRLGDEGCAVLAAALPASGLGVLSLASNGIGQHGLDRLVAGLGPGLHALLLGHSPSARFVGAAPNHVGDPGAVRLADHLRGDTALRKLDLRGNGITTRGAKALAAALDENRTLTSLDLGLGIARRAKRVIAGALARNRGRVGPSSIPPDVAAIRSVTRTHSEPTSAHNMPHDMEEA